MSELDPTTHFANLENPEMGLFDDYADYFDPQQFAGGGGLLGRLMSLQQQQGQYQPTRDSDATVGPPSTMALPSQFPSAASSTALAAAPQAPGPTAYIPIGNYLMPQFAGTGASPSDQPTPDLGDRLSAGFQSWAHTPVGNPFAGIANGIAGFSSGQAVSQPLPRNAPPRNDASQQPPVAQGALPDPPAPASINQRALAARGQMRPNVSLGRGFRYGG